MPFSNATVVLAERHIQGPMQTVFNVPVAAYILGKQTGIVVDGTNIVAILDLSCAGRRSRKNYAKRRREASRH
jgi:hypothetical protein